MVSNFLGQLVFGGGRKCPVPFVFPEALEMQGLTVHLVAGFLSVLHPLFDKRNALERDRSNGLEIPTRDVRERERARKNGDGSRLPWGRLPRGRGMDNPAWRTEGSREVIGLQCLLCISSWQPRELEKFPETSANEMAPCGALQPTGHL